MRVRVLHVGREGGAHGASTTLWTRASLAVGPSHFLALPDGMVDRDLREWLVAQLKRYQPSLLVTHCDEAIGPAAWAAGSVRVICHRYTAVPLERKTLKASTRRVVFVVPSDEAKKAVEAAGGKALLVDPEPLWKDSYPPPEKLAVGVLQPAGAERIAKHFKAHQIDVPVISGDADSLLGGSTIVVDLDIRPELNPLLLEAQRWGRLVAIPLETPQASAYGEAAIMFSDKTLYSRLLSPPELPAPRVFRNLPALRKIYMGQG